MAKYLIAPELCTAVTAVEKEERPSVEIPLRVTTYCEFRVVTSDGEVIPLFRVAMGDKESFLECQRKPDNLERVALEIRRRRLEGEVKRVVAQRIQMRAGACERPFGKQVEILQKKTRC